MDTIETMRQFLLEAVVLCNLGDVFVGLGDAIVELGMLPATKASRLIPIATFRYDQNRCGRFRNRRPTDERRRGRYCALYRRTIPGLLVVFAQRPTVGGTLWWAG